MWTGDPRLLRCALAVRLSHPMPSPPNPARERPQRRRLVAAAAASVLLLAAGRAEAIDDLLTPRSQGVGEALRADATGALGPLLNPSGMALQRAYTIEAMYGFDVRSLGSNLHLSIVDSATSRLAAGLYYTYVHSSPKFTSLPSGARDITRSGSETGIALAIALGDYVTFGVTSKYLRFATEALNPAWDGKNTPDQPEKLTLDSTISAAAADGFTIDTGLTLRLGDRFRLAAVGYNLIPLRSVDAPMALGMGAAFKATPAFTLAFDTVIDFDKYYQLVDVQKGTTERLTTVRLGGGLEWLAGGRVPIRLGAVWDSGRPGTYVTTGLGYTSTSFAIDLSYRQQVSSGIDSRLVLGLRVFLQ